jgi:hypothetical protein
MKLTAETFEDLVASLRAQHSADNINRKSARVGLHVTANMLVIEEAGVPPERHSVNIRDLSAEGISVLHHAPLRQGRPFVIELQRVSGLPLKLLCVVRHCRMVGTKLFSIGAIFRQTLSNDAAEHAAARHA